MDSSVLADIALIGDPQSQGEGVERDWQTVGAAKRKHVLTQTVSVHLNTCRVYIWH